MSENAIDNQQIQSLLRKLESLSPKKLDKALKLIGNDQLTSVMDTFAAEGRPKWKDISDFTKKQRAAKGKYPGKILQVTGALLRSWNYALIQDGVAIGTGLSYAKDMNEGMKKGSKGWGHTTVGTHHRSKKGGGETVVSSHDRKVPIPFADVPARKMDVVLQSDIDKHIATLDKKIQEVINS